VYIIDDVIIDTNVQVSGNKIESLAITPMYNCSAIKQCSYTKKKILRRTKDTRRNCTS